jgi:hypothetical protein
LESVCGVKPTEGSNPSLSAKLLNFYMNKKIWIIIIVVLLAGAAAYVLFVKNKNQESVPSPVEYTNNQYGFTFVLLQNWKEYSIVTTTWEGNAVGSQGDVPVAQGPLISIRNPNWTVQNPYQDIPVMVFTIAQWNSLQNDEFHIGAAPINPSELGRNSKYVFTLPARYNYAFLTGWEEVQSILDGKPLHVFEP